MKSDYPPISLNVSPHLHMSHIQCSLSAQLPEETYSVELERARNFFPFSFLRLPLRFPVDEQKHTHQIQNQTTKHKKYPLSGNN